MHQIDRQWGKLKAPHIAANASKIILGVAALVLAGSAFADTKPNVILLMADDMGWAQTGYYGYPHMKTPNLDDMAASGLRMDRFYAGAPSCTPTRASVMTGRTNDRTGGFRVGHAINKQEKMLSTAFRDAGYSTAHFGKWHLNEAAPPGHPLPTDDPHHPGELGFDYWLSTTSGFDRFSLEGGGFELSRNGTVERFDGDGSEVIVAEALKYIAGEAAANKPVFVVIWYSAPHGPWEGSAEDIAPFLGVVDRTSANMLGEIVAIDRSIGHLRQGLKDLGIADNTLVWFTSDNGGTPDIDYPANCSADIDPNLTSDEAREFGCYRGVHPDSGGHLRGFKKDFYEGGLRVPTIVEWPAGIEPRVSNFPSGTVDMFPTLIDVAGLSPDSINKVHDGISLAPVFKSEPARREQPLGFRASGGRMWLDNDWKLVRNVTYRPGGSITQEPYELYNVIGDPSEEHNLIDTYPERAARMRKQLDAWSLSVSRSALGWDYPEGRVLPTGREPNPELDERRRARMEEWEEEVNKASKTPKKRTDAEMSDNSNPGNLVHYSDFPTELIPPRPVDVWLPEGYDSASGDRYPVIYMHDGQFLFDRGQSPYVGTDWLWDVDRTVTRLVKGGEIRPVIVVSVWMNDKTKRARGAEYMPQKFLTDEIRQRMIAKRPELASLEFTSDNYLRFLVEELKPFIDETYRTLPGAEDTFVMGSSMGGLISAYAVAEYPDVFGGAACMSTDWNVAEGAFAGWLENHLPDAGSHRIYFDHGTETYDASYGPYQLEMDAVMRNKGYRDGEDWITRRFEGADHSPRAWRERFHVPLKFLLASRG
ncbi:MAG: sulfatase-like hydrolase/transferase [Gammaproteobacteria bacterium]|nr:sulfatase-like hydrolase/transferase [Gammaproteobacteria bacterium]